MANVLFYLKSNKSEIRAVEAIIKKNGIRFPIATGVSVPIKFWDKEKQRLRVVKNCADASTLNARLDEWERLMSSTMARFEKDLLTPSVYVFREAIKKAIADRHKEAGVKTDKRKNKKTLLYEQIELGIKNRELNPKVSRDGKDHTLYKHKKFYERLKEFALEVYKRPVDFDDIDLTFYNSYVGWLRKYPTRAEKPQPEMADNTIGREIQILKRYLNLANFEKKSDITVHKSREFKTITHQSKPYYLNEDEVNAIYDCPLEGHLDRARDHLIVGCRTALRVSDYEKVSYSVDGDLITVNETDKTKEPVYIPIHWQVEEIIKKYDGSLPPIISEQKLNKYIKVVCMKAGITQVVADNRQGYRKKGETCAKYELVTTHTGRRTGLTNMYFAGFDLYFLMTISGHTKIENLLRYIGVTRKANAMKIKDNPYFKKPTPAKEKKKTRKGKPATALSS